MPSRGALSRRPQRGGRPSLSQFSAEFLEVYRSRRTETNRSRIRDECRQREETDERMAAINTEMERRDRLTPEERLREDGRKLSLALEERPYAILTLQETPRPVQRRARCRAGECLYSSPDDEFATDIRDEYRIVLKWDGTSPMEYYHVQCIECMISLAPLARLQFKLDGSSTWSLMVGKWMEHRGRIDLDKIAAYIDRDAAFCQWLSGKAHEFSDIELRHQISCTVDRPFCGCPEMPKGPKVPVLKNYSTDEACKLCTVIGHPYGGEGRYFEDAYPPWRFDPVEDLEGDSEFGA